MGSQIPRRCSKSLDFQQAYFPSVAYPTPSDPQPVRTRYLSGRGIELGAQQVPTDVGPSCTVEYVDVVPNKYLVERYGLPEADLVPLTHVIDGNDLSVYKDGELDFVIANHVLEHFDDPVGGVLEWMRIVKPGGKLFITLPNHRGNSYDMGRTPARADHLELDHRDAAGRPARNFEHYEDFARTLYQLTDREKIREQAKKWTDDGDRHHYHVYDAVTVRDVLSIAAKESRVGLRFVDGLLSKDGFEFLMVLEKLPSGGLSWPSPLRRWLATARGYRSGMKSDIDNQIAKRFPAIYRYLAGRQYRWHQPMFEIRLADGTHLAAGRTMQRRRPNGTWEYRNLTPEEHDERWQAQAC